MSMSILRHPHFGRFNSRPNKAPANFSPTPSRLREAPRLRFALRTDETDGQRIVNDIVFGFAVTT
jgi:hypothetical protein